MSYPTQIWNPSDPNADSRGMAPYRSPMNPSVAVGIDRGLPNNWQDYNINNVSVWDALSNPLYEIAAEANGIDWVDFKSRVNTNIGPEDSYEFPESKMTTVEGRNKDASGRPNYTPGITYNSDAYEAAMNDWKNAEDSDLSNKPKRSDFTDSGPVVNKFGYSGTSGSVYSDMSKMHGWLNPIQEKSSLKGDYGIIEKGPQGSDYGIAGDIWDHYGLTSPPKGPTTLADSFFSHTDNSRMPSAGDTWHHSSIPDSVKDWSMYHTKGAVYGGMPDSWIDAAVDLGQDQSMTIDQGLLKG